ncbi:MAG: HNH endonuclease [Candidatus Hatepunaea meridiana]|nr:HNH endonuclease [Candidatus Hatepunaea meridiana]
MNESKKFKLKLREQNIPSEKLLEDLKRVANLLQKDSVGIREYNNHGNYSGDTLATRFGSWNKALETAGLTISHINLIPDEQLYNNLLNVWEKLGHQPGRRDMSRPISSIGVSAYCRRFSSWNKALVKFIEWVDHSEVSTDHVMSQDPSTSNIDIDAKHISDKNENSVYVHRTSRSPNLRLEFRVKERDGFTCRRCGRSVLKEPPGTLNLEIDHIKPWSKGGETVIENLETLCRECNRGKSNMDVDYS